MRAYSDVYLNEVVENQGKLFDMVAQKYPDKDTVDFILAYMSSKTRKSIDEGMAYVNTMDAPELWNYFTSTEQYKLKDGKALKGFLPDWIGEFYAYYQWYYNIPSREIVQKVSLDFLTKAYHGLHDLDLDLAVLKVGEKNNQTVCFHNPDEENGYLSNWYLSDFTIDNRTFSSMEQYMMYHKAEYFHDKDIARRILKTKDVATIKKLGRQVSNYNENQWNGVRQLIVYEGLFAKFSQNKHLRDKLLSTSDSVLAECAVHDTIWGIGLSMTDPNRFDVNCWKGQNLLGYSLMMVRERIK